MSTCGIGRRTIHTSGRGYRALARLLVLLALALGAHVARAADRFEGDTILKIGFRGNRKTEDEAIRQNLAMQAGEKFSRKRLRDDVHAVWRMGYFEDVKVEITEATDGVELTYLLVEKPTIRKIYVAGAHGVGIDKINPVLDLKRETILDSAKIKRNTEKIHDLYVDKGYYLAEVTSETRRVSQSEVDVYFKVDEHAKVEVRQVRFLGNKAISEEELHAAISTREGNILSFLTSSGTYKEEAFDRDLLLLTAYYYDRGYINVKLGKPEIELSGDKKYLYITIPIDEGPQYRIGKLDVRGDLLLPKDEYLRRLTVHTGDVFNRSRLGTDINKLNEIYKDRGYAYVNITPLTNIGGGDNRAVDLTFEIEQGQKVYFHRINIRGNHKTRDKVIRRELKISEGELYNQTLLDSSKKRVMALGFFEKVELSTKAWKGPANPEAAEDQIDVNIEVNERPTGTFQIGAGFSSVENFVGQAQVSQNNLFGRGQQLQLQASISSLRQFFTLRFLDPYFFDTPLTFAFTVYNSLLTYPSFNRTSRGGDITFGYLLSDNVRVFGTYKLETVRVAQNTFNQTLGGFGGFVQASPGTLSNLFRSGLISSVRFSINWDRRNDRLFPTKGVFLSGSAEAADSIIGSQAVYSRLSGFARFYYPIWGPFIFRHNTEIGYITSRSNQGVPIYERYFLGGVNTIRGFQLFSLGPRVNILQNQDPTAYLQPFNIGGNLQIITNTEIEFLIVPQVQIKGVVFFDAGNAYNTEARWCALGGSSNIPGPQNPCTRGVDILRNLRTSAGFGFRWNSPIGPLRFEWGIPLRRLPGERPVVFEFTIGNFF
ncbi:MAG TPA: outer membrane protein assembly factor BamA [Polyangia bacterium]|nr:outer membrane protein assembly factor BamA [Polyangia bacterium]